MRFNKKILFLLFFINAAFLCAQTPGLNYQAIVLNNTTIEIPGTDVKESQVPLGLEEVVFRFTITNEDGIEYIEEHSVITDKNGMVSLIVGEGTPTLFNFDDINWDGELKYLNVEIDILKNNEGFTFLDSQKILSIPGSSKGSQTTIVKSIDLISPPNKKGDLSWVEEHGPNNNPTLVIFNGTDWVPVTKDFDPTNELAVPVVANAANRDTQFNPAVAGDQVWNQTCGCLEVFDGNNWVAINNNSLAAINGVHTLNNKIRLGGDLNSPTEINTSATNTLAIKNLEESTATEDQVVVINKDTGVLKKKKWPTMLSQEQVVFTAADGQLRFATPKPIMDTNKIDVYRNGARIGFVQVDATTIELEPEAICYAGDEVRIVMITN